MTSAIVNHGLENLALPQNDAYLSREGFQLLNRGEYQAAWDHFNEAIHLNPNIRVYFVMRGTASMHLGHFESALSDYNQAMDFPMNDREKGLLYLDLVALYWRMGDRETAYSHMASAARLGNGTAQNYCRYYGIPF